MPKEKKKQQQTEEPIDFPQRYGVVAADFSLKRPGFCLMTVVRDENGPKITEMTTTNVDNRRPNRTHGELLHQILLKMAYFFPEDDLAGFLVFFVREKAFNSRAAMSEIGIFKVVGLADWFLGRLGKTWHELYPVSVKKLVTGSGKADKMQVANALRAYLGDRSYATDDESDAAAVAVAWLILHGQLKMISSEEPTHVSLS